MRGFRGDFAWDQMIHIYIYTYIYTHTYDILLSGDDSRVGKLEDKHVSV